MPAYQTAEYKHLLDAERMLAADIQDPETAAKDRAACARVLASVIDMKRVLRMRPKPKDIDVSKGKPARQRASVTNQSPFTEPTEGISLPTQTVTTPPT